MKAAEETFGGSSTIQFWLLNSVTLSIYPFGVLKVELSKATACINHPLRRLINKPNIKSQTFRQRV